MSLIAQTRVVARWIEGTLSADPTIQGIVGAPPNDRIYNRIMPEGSNTVTVQYPAVVFTHMSGRDVRPAGKQFVMANFLYLITAIDKTESWLTIEPLVNQITALLDNQIGSASGGSILYCQREGHYEDEIVDRGIQYRRLGGLFRIYAQ